MINDTYSAAGAKLREIRKSKRLSSFKVASKLNISRKYIKQVEKRDNTLIDIIPYILAHRISYFVVS